MGLAPTTPRKARLLLKEGKALIEYRQPFTIRLKYKTGCASEHLKCGVDTGSQHIGTSLILPECKRVLDKSEYKLRSTMEKRTLMETRREYRRGRRFRKTRYRHPKYKPHTKRVYVEKPVTYRKHPTHWKKQVNTFASSREEGWLPPSIRSKLDQHILLIRRYQQALPPKTIVRIEVGRFDIQHMMDPSIRGEMYQRGPMYESENIKAYIFARDNYQCQCCGKKAGAVRKDGTTVKLKVHHVDFQSKGATDNPSRLASVCDKCHTEAAHKPGGVLYGWMIEGKKFSRGYRDATFMNIIRKRLREEFPDAEFTYGNITAADRKILKLEKTHGNDAVAIAAHGMNTVDNTEETTYYRQLRKQKRSLHEANPRKGRKEPNRLAARNRKNTCVAGGRYLNDKVKVLDQMGWVSGFSGNSSVYVKNQEGEYITMPGKSYKMVPISQTKLITHCNNWAVYIKCDKPLSGQNDAFISAIE